MGGRGVRGVGSEILPKLAFAARCDVLHRLPSRTTCSTQLQREQRSNPNPPSPPKLEPPVHPLQVHRRVDPLSAKTALNSLDPTKPKLQGMIKTTKGTYAASSVLHVLNKDGGVWKPNCWPNELRTKNAFGPSGDEDGY